MTARLCLTNLSGTWTPEQVASSPDLVVCGEMWAVPPVRGAARTLVYVEATSYIARDGLPYGAPGSYNLALGEWAQAGGFDKFEIDGGRKWGESWGGGDPRNTIQQIDITKRGAVAKIATLRAEHFGWSDGLNLNGWCSLGWIHPTVPAEYWKKWDAALASMGNAIRALWPDAILCGQQWQIDPVTFAPLNGYMLEQSPTSFGKTFADHAYDKKRMDDIMARAFPKRESVWIAELREPARYTGSASWYPDAVRQWTDSCGMYCSWGRDQTAGLGWNP